MAAAVEAFKEGFEAASTPAPASVDAAAAAPLEASQPDADDAECAWKVARARGVAAFAAKDLAAADGHFRDAIAALCPVILGDGDARDGDGFDEVPRYEHWTRKSFAELCSCRAAVLLRRHRHGEALAQATRALEVREDWAKAAMQVAKARLGLGQRVRRRPFFFCSPRARARRRRRRRRRRRYDKAAAACDAECLQAPPELAAQARALKERVERAAYGGRCLC